MGNYDKTSTERNFQERFTKELEKYRWIAPDELDGNKQKVTVNDLINHWRSELNRINADQLEGIELTDSEFAQVMAKVSQIDNSFEAAKILAMEGSTGKIDGIYRDNNPRITRKQITLTIFKKAEVRGGDSSYKIAREISTDKGNRFDIVLLINGLPLINIEQKRADKTLDEAFGQFKRYYRDGEYVNSFMVFSQMMVITSEVATRYFATPKSINDFNLSFVFGWADKHNKPINSWQEIVAHLLMIPMAHQLVGDYLIIDEAEEEENRRHMIMRPYQVYALQAVEGAAFGWDNEDKIPHGGYVWHTTGSGKTITSFKTALFLSTRGGFDKVIFLVDRKELDKKTSENFKAYASYEPVTVDDTKHTYHLRKQLLSVKKGIIVTTTYKLSNLVKNLLEAQDYGLAKKRLIFIIDEAHRTTMGEMMVNIRSYFKKNSLFYGYTGTPLFDENEVTGMINEKSEVIDTTEKLFGPELHKYTINQAIGDGNVLGFHVDYINTGEFLHYEDLRDQVKDKVQEEKPEMTIREIDHLVRGWNDLEVEKEAKKRKILVYQDETHIPRVVEEILLNWEEQSQERHFNAILTVAERSRVLAYYDEFKRQLNGQDNKINIAMTFSFGNENDINNIPPEIIELMFKDYAKFTGIEFISGDRRRGEEAYFEDIVSRGTRGGSGRNKKNIDLIIVAEQLLTGYDSRFLNTLYIDRDLRLQNLIQAYSRTNRIYGKNKEFGSIINFQYPKITEERVNIALKLYGSGGKSSRAIVEDYKTAVEKFSIKVLEMLKVLEDPTKWQELQMDSEVEELFILSFMDANDQLRLVMQYYEYKWDNEGFGIDEHGWLKYVGAYKNLIFKIVDPPEDEPIIPLIGGIKLSGTQVIDANHILSLIGSRVKTDKGVQTVDSETLRLIYEEIQELSDMGEDEQAKLLKEFVEVELLPGNLSSNLSFDESFDKWKQERVEREIKGFAQYWGIDESLLSKSVDNFSIVRDEGVPYIDELSESVDFNIATNQEAGNELEHRMNLLNKALPEWIIEIKKKYN
ncbi:type I restriction endonuclease subunit R [Tissierella creatinophila]|uniref:Type I restriction enzyme endonuclease subunit n=1 Tax=Tissierella creatinophila DSM 6911 TaxID=1123403 RepID=A0A1U7M3R2_TISCR|nr:HsdR family type I site-specific deoxyribonuclease [Tissierella creatinophila]OLS01952.1 type-1 restriction enzyme R protein [Tissierella creatinophila DSM 6911]